MISDAATFYPAQIDVELHGFAAGFNFTHGLGEIDGGLGRQLDRKNSGSSGKI